MARRRHRLGIEALLRDHLNVFDRLEAGSGDVSGVARPMAVAAPTHRSGRAQGPAREVLATAFLFAAVARARDHGEDRHRLRSADDGSACAGAALPLAGRVPGLRLAGQSRRAVQARAGARRCRGRQVDPKTWRFKLRQGVVFHDGTPFTVDDAVFSMQRALTPPSQRCFQLKGVIGGEEGRRADARDPARGARRGAARQVHQPADDEQGLVAGEQGRDRAGLQRQAGNLRGAQRQRHRPVPARALRARHPHGAEEGIRAGGAGATSARATSTRSSG